MGIGAGAGIDEGCGDDDVAPFPAAEEGCNGRARFQDGAPSAASVERPVAAATAASEATPLLPSGGVSERPRFFRERMEEEEEEEEEVEEVEEEDDDDDEEEEEEEEQEE